MIMADPQPLKAPKSSAPPGTTREVPAGRGAGGAGTGVATPREPPKADLRAILESARAEHAPQTTPNNNPELRLKQRVDQTLRCQADVRQDTLQKLSTIEQNRSVVCPFPLPKDLPPRDIVGLVQAVLVYQVGIRCDKALDRVKDSVRQSGRLRESACTRIYDPPASSNRTGPDSVWVK
jgi:hypothetical protein